MADPVVPIGPKDQPVFVILNGLGLLASSIMVLLAVFGVIVLTDGEIAIRAVAIQGFANAIAGIIWPFVTPNSKVVERRDGN